MSEPIPVRGEVTFRFFSPGLAGPVERTVTVELDRGLVTAPEAMQQVNFQSDCKVHVDRWLEVVKKARPELVAALEGNAYTAAVLIEVAEAADA